MLKKLLLALFLCANSVGAQSLSQLPRSTVATGLNDSTLIMISDSARRTRAARALDFRAMLSLRAFDSLATANLRLTSGVFGSATWSGIQTFVTGQKVDTALLAKNLTGSPAITVSSCTGCGSGTAFPLLGPSGTAGAPTYSFSSDTTMGFFRASAGNLGFATAGTERFRFSNSLLTFVNSSGIIAVDGVSRTMTLQTTTSAGTAKNTLVLGADTSATFLGQIKALSNNGIAGYIFSGDTDTGIENPLDGMIQFRTNGTARWSINSTGTLEPTSSTSGSLRIPNGTAAAPSLALSGSTTTGLYRVGADTIGLALGGVQRIRYLATVSGPRIEGIVDAADNLSISAIAPDVGGIGLFATAASVPGQQVASFSVSSTTIMTDGNTSFSVFGGATPTWRGGGGNLTIQSGSGNSRTMTLATTTSAGTAKNTLVLGADTSTTFLGKASFPGGLIGGTQPTISFTGSPTTGFYTTSASSSTDIQTSLGGTAGPDISKNGSLVQLRLRDNTAAIPALSFVNYPTTGIYGGSNQISFSIGGTEAFRVRSDGDVATANASVLGTQAGSAVHPGFYFAASNLGSSGFYHKGASGLDTIVVSIDSIARFKFSDKLVGGDASMTILAGTGNSRKLALQTTTSAGVATDAMRFNEVQQSLAADGASGRPGIAYAADTSTGFRRLGTGRIAIVGSGTTLLDLDGPNSSIVTTFPIRHQDGTAAEPSVTFVNSSNSGMYLLSNASADTLAFTANGTVRLKLADLAATAAGDVALCVSTISVIRQGATCGTSSSKVKTDIRLLAGASTKLMALRPVSYSYQRGFYEGRAEFGLIAEEAAKVDPRLVFFAERDDKLPNGQTIRKGDPINVNDRAVLALLLAEVQQLRREVDSLKAVKKP